jgi:hypothetical protein
MGSVRPRTTLTQEVTVRPTDLIRPRLRGVFLPLCILAIAGAAPAAMAQIPDEFTNLKVLPKDISKRELVGAMRGFASGLGVRCNHCHPGPENLQGMDFATDELETKRIARTMMLMTREINQTHLPATKREAPTKVECSTCHRGLTDPRSLKAVLADTLEETGSAGAVKQYRELRDEHYGGGSYDFGAGTLNSLAESLARGQKDVDGAVELMRLNVEFNPDAAFSHLLLGQIYAAKGDTPAAIASIERCLELEPDNRWAKQSLDALKKAPDSEKPE